VRFLLLAVLAVPAVPAVLAVGGCSGGPSEAGVAPSLGTGGPDAILLRVPRDGGRARAYRWGRDSVLWSSAEPVPALARVLAFDDDRGLLAYVDAQGMPGRLDLRVGTAGAAAAGPLRALASADGWAIFGLTAMNEVSRLTLSGVWTFRPSSVPRALLPLSDGSLVLLQGAGERLRLRRLHPPEPRVTDTASVPSGELVVQTELGDRLYFLGDSGLAGVRVRDLARTKTLRLPGAVEDAVATPSGDRIFVALRGRKMLAIIDRYAEAIAQTIALPDDVTALRMDPDGRYVLARTAGGDSVRVIAVGTSRVLGGVRSDWRADLPLVAPDGFLAVVQDEDVVVVDAETGRERERHVAGASDFWALVRWNGFRPRAAGLDEPVLFAADSDLTSAQAAIDSALAARVAPLPGAPPPDVRAPDVRAPDVRAPDVRAPGVPPPLDPRTGPAGGRRVYSLSFAAMLSEERANTLAASIRVDGHPVRVVPGTRDGTPVFRVVYGPFSSREEADRAGRRSGLPYWVYQGAP